MDKSTDKLVQGNVLFAIDAIRRNIERAIRKKTIIELSESMISLCEEYKSLRTLETKVIGNIHDTPELLNEE